ncbi:TonB-dependent receptor [Sphingomonas oleivorans]|uniref:TonB-dependent receptor n=2 Tax=Sphingomonas oleivorans TaxID=1735121 RepID=A0A2T5FZX3_9SPHN|nr:TonB-dependent receptor [Sphingomonas oleivorans]
MRSCFDGKFMFLLAGVAAIGLTAAPAAQAAAPAAEAEASSAGEAESGSSAGEGDAIVVTGRTTRSVTQLAGTEIQKILPGINPLKAIQTLPGVTFNTADPWGNNEQNTSLFIHGFNAQQLGYTLDGVPLGDQNYGNYNGLSPQRAVISENVGNVLLSTGAADLATASTSNLGGAIETFTSDPLSDAGLLLSQTVGSHSTSRTYARIDSGTFGNGNALYVSGVRQRAYAWDFRGRQGGYQANAKFVHDDSSGKLTLYFAYSDKTEPNEDSTVRSPTQAYQPYTRPFLYPDFQAALAYLSATGATPAAEGVNYRNYYSDAQRTDYLTYAKYDWHIADNISWSNQGYYHNNDGAGVVAGPITVASLPQLFALYFPGQNLKERTGNSGYATRTTEYRIDRAGFITALDIELGDHQIELGGWYENNSSSAYRRWYALDVNNPSTPYQRPKNPLFTQYGSEIRNDVYQFHLQDQWRVIPTLALQAGFKSSLQYGSGTVPVQPIVGSLPGSIGLPEGRINTKKWFLPQLGALWDVTPEEQIFVNVQRNMRQFMTYGAGGISPWSLGSQATFDLFKRSVEPETAWTYEVGLRTRRSVDAGPLTAIEGQINYYHVDFKDRLLGVNAVPGGSIAGGAQIIQNVGNVKTDGVDAAITLRFGRTFSLYNALSYNRSVYQDDYQTGTTTVGTAGKKVPGSPEWLNKTVATLTIGGLDVQAIGDYVGKRYATYTNDQSVPHYFLMSLRAGYTIPLAQSLPIKKAEISVNVTNVTQERGTSTVGVGSASNTYNTFPIPPRQWFATLSLGF